MTATKALTDGLIVTKRNLIKIKRVPDLLIFSTISPIMFILLFAYVFGSQISVPGTNYREFLIPGIFAQTVIFVSTTTGAGLADNWKACIIEFIISAIGLPEARGAVAHCSPAPRVRPGQSIGMITSVSNSSGFWLSAIPTRYSSYAVPRRVRPSTATCTRSPAATGRTRSPPGSGSARAPSSSRSPTGWTPPPSRRGCGWRYCYSLSMWFGRRRAHRRCCPRSEPWYRRCPGRSG